MRNAACADAYKCGARSVHTQCTLSARSVHATVHAWKLLYLNKIERPTGCRPGIRILYYLNNMKGLHGHAPRVLDFVQIQ